MKSTITLAGNLNTNPFEIFRQDVDEVIMLINFYIELSTEDNGKTEITTSGKTNKKQRIKVNDNTATGGWW